MNTKDLLLAFFEAENKRDWATYRAFLSTDVIWVLHARRVRTIRGIDDYLTAMIEAYEDCDSTFICESLYQSSDGSRIVTILKNSFGERSCDVFEFADGYIVKEYEFILG